MQVAIRRLLQQGRMSLADELPEDYVQFERDGDGIRAHSRAVGLVERPPLASLR
jgi:hypothetical protein